MRIYQDLIAKEDYHQLHDLLEEIWEKTPLGKDKLELQAFIQIAVAMHHQQKGNYRGCEILLEKASHKLGIKLDDAARAKDFLLDQLSLKIFAKS